MKFLSTLFAAVLLGIGTHATTVQCSYTDISSDITSNTTWSASTLYRLTTCVHVTSGHTLTIPEGTIIMATPDAALVIDRGAKIDAQGQYDNPIIFTSDQEPGDKDYAQWDGIYILGKAKNNQGNSLTVTDGACDVTGGGTDDDDNSGIMQYVRIEYSNFGFRAVSAGRGTTLDHIQVSYSAHDGFQFLGGTVDVSYLATLNVKGNDFLYEYGTQNKNQYLLAIRTDSTAHLVSAPSYGIVAANNESLGTGYAGTPMTHPVFSNCSFVGPRHCTSPVNSLFAAGVLIEKNAEIGFYNNVVSGWTTGVIIDGDEAIDNVLTYNTVNVDYNSFANNLSDYEKVGTWSSGCAPTIGDWMTGNGICTMENNQFAPSFTLGYSNTLCGDYSMTRPVFLLSGTDLDVTNYDAPELAGMEEAVNQGSINSSTDITEDWTNWDPLNFNPCSPLPRMSTTGVATVVDEQDKLVIAPNPSEGLTYVSFDATQQGEVTITVTNSIGQVVRTMQQAVNKGSQKIALPTDGLSAGMYIINVNRNKGNTAHAQLIVK